jgi:hypothetical protein
MRRLSMNFYAVMTLLVLLAGLLSFIQDDAFISFRYADNLVNGEGLVWNPGEYVEGYTNFLWTIWIAALIWLGLDPVLGSQLSGLLLFIGTIVLLYHTAREAGLEEWACLAVILVAGTNWTFVAYATGGLETQLVAFLIAAQLFVMLRYLNDEHRLDMLWWWSTTGALAILTRMDSILLMIPMGVTLLFMIFYRPTGWIPRLLRLVVPGVLIISPWLAWKLYYYGSILPNTFYAKAGNLDALRYARGLNYAYYFFIFYGFTPFILIFLIIRWRTIDVLHGMILATLSLWILYVAYTGGDFMEWRPFVVIVPLVALLIVRLVEKNGPRLVWPAVITLAVMSATHGARLYAAGDERGGVESVHKLQERLYKYDSNWVGIGKRLGEVFAGDTIDLPKIAINPAGAIPFYSRLPAFDMLSLTSPEVTKGGLPNSTKPGHEKIATPKMVHKAGVDIYLGPAKLFRGSLLDQAPLTRANAESWFCAGVLEDPEMNKAWCDELLQAARILIIPMGDAHDMRLVGLLLRNHPLVVRRTNEGAIEIHKM